MSLDRFGPTLTWLVTVMAMSAFAANSVLCRLALRGEVIDAASFTAIRLISGAIVLVAFIYTGSKPPAVKLRNRGWLSPLMLFAYAISFSLAYIDLPTATGALILFGVVQLTMVSAAWFSDEGIRLFGVLGVLLAFAGLIWLASPGVAAPSLTGSLLMVIAGVSWGMYSFLGRNSDLPLIDTGRNFLWALPFLLFLAVPIVQRGYWTPTGLTLAVISGAVTSGLGYVLWFIALRGLSTVQASAVQLSVPVLAAAGGTLFLNEPLGQRVFVGGGLILLGIVCTLPIRR